MKQQTYVYPLARVGSIDYPYGRGFIAGQAPPPFEPDHPDGRTYVDGVLKSLTVKAFDVNTNIMVATTDSFPDGTWNLLDISPDRRYQVIFQNNTYTDLNGDKYNSFVQDFISGVPISEDPNPPSGWSSIDGDVNLCRWTPGQEIIARRITPFGVLPNPTVSGLTSTTINSGIQINRIRAPVITNPSGNYNINVNWTGGSDTIAVKVKNQPIYESPYIALSIHPAMNGASLGPQCLRDGRNPGGGTTAPPEFLTPIATVSSNAYSNELDLSPSVPYMFKGGSAVGPIFLNTVAYANTAPATPFSMSCFVQMRSLPSSGKRTAIVQFSNTPSNNVTSFQILSVDSAGVVRFENHDWTTNQGTTFSMESRKQIEVPGFVMQPNVMYHIHYQQDGTVNKWSQIFIDGQLVANEKFLPTTLNPAINPMGAGNSTTWSSNAVGILSIPIYWGMPTATQALYEYGEGYVGKVEFTNSYAGQSSNFSVLPLRNNRIYYPKSSGFILPLIGSNPLKDVVTERDIVTNVGTPSYDPVLGTRCYQGTTRYALAPVPYSAMSGCLELWFMMLPESTGNNTIVQYSNHTSIAALNSGGCRLVLSSTKQITAHWVKQYVSTVGNPNNTPFSVTGSTTIQPNVWYHAALAFDAIKSEFKFFLNGNLEGTATKPYNFATVAPIVGCQISIGRGGVTDAITAGTTVGFEGWVRGVRFMAGTPYYSVNFTPPTVEQIAADQIPAMY